MKFSASEKIVIPGTVHGIDNELMEGNTNNLASQYIVDNYDKLVFDVLKMGIDKEKNIDLINDVYCKIVEREQNGKGFDPSKGRKEAYIEVKHYIYKMLSDYGKNIKYRKQKVADLRFKELSSSYSGENISDLTVNQMVYKQARGYDEIEGLDEQLSIFEEIEFILSFESSIQLDLRFLMKNIRNIASQLSSIDTAIFNPLKRLVKREAELKESLRTVVKFAISFPDTYDTIVEKL